MKFTVKSNFAEVAKQLSNIQRRQMPFAIASTLTKVAHEARRHIIETTGPRDFNLRNKQFLRVTLRVDKATKSRLEARIYDGLGRPYLKTQAEGGDKVSTGKRFAIPLSKIAAQRGPRGVPKSLRPANLKRSFKIQIGDNVFLARRTGRASRLEVAYLLERKVRIPQRFNAYRDVAQVVRLRSDQIFAEELARALATAR